KAGRDVARPGGVLPFPGFRKFSRVQAGARSRSRRNLDARSAHRMGWSAEGCAGETEGVGDGLTARPATFHAHIDRIEPILQKRKYRYAKVEFSRSGRRYR